MLSVFMRTARGVPKNEIKMKKLFGNTESVATFATLTDGNCTYLAGQAVNLLIYSVSILSILLLNLITTNFKHIMKILTEVMNRN